jgi:hypothetical protein
MTVSMNFKCLRFISVMSARGGSRLQSQSAVPLPGNLNDIKKLYIIPLLIHSDSRASGFQFIVYLRHISSISSKLTNFLSFKTYIKEKQITNLCTVPKNPDVLYSYSWKKLSVSIILLAQFHTFNRNINSSVMYRRHLLHYTLLNLTKFSATIPLNLSPTKVLLLATNKILPYIQLELKIIINHFEHCCVLMNLTQRWNRTQNIYHWAWYINHFSALTCLATNISVRQISMTLKTGISPKYFFRFLVCLARNLFVRWDCL